MRLIKLPKHERDDGEVVVIEGTPFIIKRVFFLAAKDGAERGKHAHRKCTQLIVCVNGEVDVNCNSGYGFERFTIASRDVAVLVPPMIWVSICFWGEAVVSVLCDRAYEEHDYIRDYPEFLNIVGHA